MNKLYKLKWSNTIRKKVTVAELSKRKRKNCRPYKTILSVAIVTVGIATESIAFAREIDNSQNISTATYADFPISDIVTDGTPTFITNTGDLSTEADGTHTIKVNNPTGNTTIDNAGNLFTKGSRAHVIYVNSSTGTIQITNSGKIETLGSYAYGIYAVSSSGDINIQNTGDLIISDGPGIVASSAGIGASVTINASGNITTNQNLVAAANGLQASSEFGTNTVIFDNGTLKAVNNAVGIASYDRSSNSVDNKSFIYVGSNGVVDTSLGRDALEIRTNGYGEINVAKGALVIGGTRAAIHTDATGTTAATHVINNGGTLQSSNDVIIVADTQTAGSTLTFNNTGEMTGIINVLSMNTTLQNDSLWNIRDFQDTNFDGINDNKSVAINNFGSGTTTINNRGTLNLAAVNGETSVNTTGEYVPIGALSISNAGTIQGQILKLNTFQNSGLIDMTANNQAGDVLVISGGGTAGTYGSGTFISNGGSLKMNTLLNEGGAASQTDMLVLDNVQVGENGATKIYITPVANSIGGNTEGDGIQIIQTLGSQDSDAFILGNSVTSGAYEYKLYANNASGNMNGWYLRNNNGGSAFLNPNIGSYIGNQYATNTMFNQNVLDRRESVRNSDQNIWMRLSYNDTKYDLLNDRQHARTKNTILQAGIDIIRQNGFTAGSYIGYGRSNTENKSNQTGSTSKAKADGYQIGLYGTWMPDENKGPYVDLWTHYAWYKNKLEGNAQLNKNVKYDSHGYAMSIEMGYGFEFFEAEASSTWIIQPHAQIIYNNIKSDGFVDHNNTSFSDRTDDGLQTRLGARLYGQNVEGEYGVLPFVEANWLYNGTNNSVKLNGSTFKEKIGENVGELKLGVQGKINDKFSLFTYLGGQRGANNYKRGEVQAGLNLKW